MPAKRDKTGLRFGRWIVVARAAASKWFCRCDCGVERLVEGCNLVRGVSQSCGCLHKELLSKRQRKHGQTHSREYASWNAMKVRCYNSTRAGFKDYGGRGIRVCRRWMDSFENFLKDMGPRPMNTSLNRKDNDKGYSPTNCEWADRAVQNNNSRQNVLLKFKRRTQTVAMWAREVGLKAPTIRRRLEAGWTVNRALTEPAKEWTRYAD